MQAVYATDKISDFLQETELQNIAKPYWGIGAKLARAGGKAVISLLSVKSATDQILISANREVVLPIIAETLGKVGLALKDPAVFDIPTATFAVLMARSFLGQMGKPCLVFLTLKAVSEGSTHVLIEGHTKGPAKGASYEIKRVRDEISARFR
jgi:hypothetical protein